VCIIGDYTYANIDFVSGSTTSVLRVGNCEATLYRPEIPPGDVWMPCHERGIWWDACAKDVTFSFASGEGSDHNALFAIDENGDLRTNAENIEGGMLSIRVRASRSDAWLETVFTIQAIGNPTVSPSVNPSMTQPSTQPITVRPSLSPSRTQPSLSPSTLSQSPSTSPVATTAGIIQMSTYTTGTCGNDGSAANEPSTRPTFENLTLEQCQQRCLDDTQCTAVELSSSNLCSLFYQMNSVLESQSDSQCSLKEECDNNMSDYAEGVCGLDGWDTHENDRPFFGSISSEECQQRCLEDSQCSAAEQPHAGPAWCALFYQANSVAGGSFQCSLKTTTCTPYKTYASSSQFIYLFGDVNAPSRLTCHGHGKLSHPCKGSQTCSVFECEQLCLGNDACKFYFSNERNGCLLYRSCTRFRSASFLGWTKLRKL